MAAEKAPKKLSLPDSDESRESLSSKHVGHEGGHNDDNDDNDNGNESGPKTASEDKESQHGLGAEYSTLHEAAFVLVICMGQFLSLAGLAVTIAPLAIISESFGTMDPGLRSWLTAGYSLGVGTFIMPAGRLGDIYGHRRLFVIGFCWFALWSLIAGFSAYADIILLSTARGLQGVGPAIIVPNALAMLGRTYKEGRKKSMAFGMYAAAAPIGFFFGALFSSIFAQFAWWPWAFWVLAIACCVQVAAALLIIPSDRIESKNVDGEKPHFDHLGCITGVSGLVLINFAWNQAAIQGWQTTYLYILLIVGFVFLAGFAYIELHVASQPLIPLRGLTKEAYLALACISAGWGSFGLWVYYLWLLLEQVRRHSALSAVAQSAPTIISGLAASIATGYLLTKIPVASLLFASFLFFITGLSLLATAPANQTYWAQTFVSILLMPCGLDISFPSTTAIVSNSMPKEHQGMAASLVNTVVNYSISLGLGFGGTMLHNLDPENLHPFTDFRYMWYLGIGLDVAGLIIAAFFVWSHYRGKARELT